MKTKLLNYRVFAGASVEGTSAVKRAAFFLTNSLIASMFMCTVVAHGADLSGTWLITERSKATDDLVVCTTSLSLVQEPSGSLSGTLQSCVSRGSVEGRVTGDEFVLRGRAGHAYFDFPITLRGTGRSSELKGNESVAIPEQTFQWSWSARPTTAAELSALRATIPEYIKLGKLPLPPLHDLTPNGLALTPPMGWNGYNKFDEAIDEKLVRESADSLVSSGLKDAGYIYVNLDAGWQGQRDAAGILRSNAKFPDMKRLADYLHSMGLKFGIYSSPGPIECGGRAGSHGFEAQDAQTFADWGVDYLKYDVCSAAEIYDTNEDMRALYQKMGEALRSTGRPIIYSLSLAGHYDVGTWARSAGANLWRTGRDIWDTWATMSKRGFDENGPASQAGPGGWNDLDMLEIGNGGMTVEEYRTHMTLWCMSASPLILGNDVRHMTAGIKSILENREVIGVNQDSLGAQGQRVLRDKSTEIWIKPLSGGSMAVALFNRGSARTKIIVPWEKLGIGGPLRLRDLWRHADMAPTAAGKQLVLPGHGSVLLRVER